MAKKDSIPKGMLLQYLEEPSIAKPIAEMQLVVYEGPWAKPIIKCI